MAFELISWVYISCICFVWGDLFVRFILRGRFSVADSNFPVLCFVGMSAMAIVALYFSLFFPLYGWIKIILQIPALFYFLFPSNRSSFVFQCSRLFGKLSGADLFLLLVSIIMVLFLSVAPVIHPDTLNYHIYSIRVFDKYGMIPGIVNLRLDLGFQSLWFAAMSVFDFTFFQPNTSYPLSGCVLSWFIIFLISKSSVRRVALTERNRASVSGAPYLLLLLFTEISWTQIRLTAASASPDFIVTLMVLAAFYFFSRNPVGPSFVNDLVLAVFFSILALTIKLSAVVIILVSLYIFLYGFLRKNIFLVRTVLIMWVVFLTPILVRNIVASGYPLYPSSFGNVFPVDWKISGLALTRLQHYITNYARYSTPMKTVDADYRVSFGSWLPLWWRHLYMADKLLVLFVFSGLVLNMIYLKKWVRALSANIKIACLISLAGTAFWFINGPDPRFGTGFLLSLVYFLFFPFFSLLNYSRAVLFYRGLTAVKYLAALLVMAYIIYRGIFFFHVGQLIFPDGIRESPPVHADCTDYIKEMLFRDSHSSFQIPDSCKTFLLRGNSIKDGFRPIE